jgi:BASS family bile acid:Na+ symporter
MLGIQDVLVGAFVISMMVSVGSDLTWERLRAIVRRPRLLGGGLLAAYLCVPLAAWLLGTGLGLSAGLFAGLMLCAAAPGGPIGALFTQRAGGNLALSVSLLMAVNFINVLATPFTIQLLGVTPGDDIIIALLGMVGTILAFQIFPLVVGVQLRERRPELAEKVGRWGRRVANLLLVGAIVGFGISEADLFLQVDPRVLIAGEGVTLVAIVSGWLLVPGDRATKKAGAMSNAMRSQSLSILLASTQFSDPETLVAVLCFSILMFINGLAAAEIFRRTMPED